MISTARTTRSQKRSSTHAPQLKSSTTSTIVIPTYNERETICTAIERTLTAFEGNVNILIVDDSSPDGTAHLINSEYGTDDRIQVLVRDGKNGLASAIAHGVEHVTTDTVLVADADLQHPPEVFPDLVDAIQDGADIAIGSRYVDGGGINGWPLSRRVLSRGAALIAKAGVPQIRGISDPMSGLFAFQRDVIDPSDMNAPGFKVLLQVLTKGDYDRVVDVPYTFQPRAGGDSTLGWREQLEFLEHIAMLRIESLPVDLDPERTVAVGEFAIVGGIGVLVNMLVFMSVLWMGAHYAVAGVLAFLAAVNSNFIGNWLITFDQPEGSLRRQYVAFCGVSIAGFAVYSLFLVGAIELATLPEMIANLIAIAGGSAWNYLGSEKIAFASEFTG